MGLFWEFYRSDGGGRGSDNPPPRRLRKEKNGENGVRRFRREKMESEIQKRKNGENGVRREKMESGDSEKKKMESKDLS
jgi:hypothetical protein